MTIAYQNLSGVRAKVRPSRESCIIAFSRLVSGEETMTYPRFRREVIVERTPGTENDDRGQALQAWRLG